MCPICCTLLLIAGFLVLVYVFLTWNFDYWRKRGIETAESWPFVGSFPSMFTKKRNVAYDIDDIYQQYKETDNMVGVFTTRRPQLLVLCPEYINKIYASDFRCFRDNERGNFVDKKVDKILGNNPFVLKGDEWKERRAEITPGLSLNRVKAVYPVSQSVCKQFVEYIRRQQRMANSEGLDAKRLSLCYTTEVVSDCVLGISAQSFTDTPTPLLAVIQRVFNSSFKFILYGVLANIWPPIRRFYSLPLFNKEAEEFFFDLMGRCIALRREKVEQQRDDFLNYMLQLQEKKGLADSELTAHTMTFLTDGFETTALVLSHTLLMLARHPEQQQKVRDEIGKAELSFEQLTELPYLEACIHETLRLFSPQLTARKLVTEPYEFANKNGSFLRLHPGDVVIIPVNSLHHDPQYYENPHMFKPERFLEANGGVKKYRDLGVYLPFGNGPRICPGIRFALTQLKAALVEIVRNFEISVNSKTRSDNRLSDTFYWATLKGGIWLEFMERYSNEMIAAAQLTSSSFASALASGCVMCPISTALFSIAAILALIYVFLTWNFSYWKKRGIPTAKSWPFVGSFPSIFTQKRNVVYDMDEIYEQYKNTDSIVGVFQTRIPQLMVTTPEYAHKVFVSDFRSFHDNEMAKFTDTKKDPILSNNPFILTGEAWKERRAEVTPGLSANRVKAAYPVSQRVCKKFVEYIKRQSLMAASHGLNAKDICLCYTTEVISDCVLGISAQSFTDNPTPMVGMTKRVFEQSFGFIFYTVVANLWPPITKLFSVSLFAKDVAEFFYDIMRKCIQVRRESPAAQQRDDFLNYMLQLQEKKGLDALELTSHTMTFLTDGFETTAQVLTHTLLFLARNPEEQRKLREEVGTAELSFEQISELPFTEACIHETLRIFPPGLAARKVVTEPYEIANKNGVSVKLNPGDVVIVPINALHNDPQYYEDPQSFKPERFLDGGAKKYRDQGVYFGFGDGPRICPGMRFSLTQIKAALVEIVRNFDIKVNPKTRKDNIIDDTYFMAALKGGVWLDFVERK
ncbi:uncharacterized protein Dyak_GE25311 [Drosophila yakuba]|uniref:Uncharacterized protein n=1 Tax=Drosophila yakuba TaxID=7245 RepID=B4P087_DROYA|nr:uncharacterized protein Dyak_GE25311 [Drosophila yakuba]